MIKLQTGVSGLQIATFYFALSSLPPPAGEGIIGSGFQRDSISTGQMESRSNEMESHINEMESHAILLL